ncbi:hypothetical protein [Shewanella sp. UCD-KL12]|uniref:hypothetical protein n=1 Tax=Shewanella sp. UCD-KL12 TaxID=1917163 RepID=UPI000970B5C4|nr:hypothetical protein [Shewanella sp. UCD-KL12]
MNKLANLKLVAIFFGVALGLSATSAIASSCTESCKTIAKQQQIQICAGGGGSACASSEPLFNYLYEQCVQNQCSN